jgi:hypothetical protein
MVLILTLRTMTLRARMMLHLALVSVIDVVETATMPTNAMLGLMWKDTDSMTNNEQRSMSAERRTLACQSSLLLLVKVNGLRRALSSHSAHPRMGKRKVRIIAEIFRR